jgi:hypothetical protein
LRAAVFKTAAFADFATPAEVKVTYRLELNRPDVLDPKQQKLGER